MAAASTAAFLALGGVGSALWMNRPFRVELASYRTSVAERMEAQRHNIRLAMTALDGTVIEPGAEFSFNQSVGPRTVERGYREAPAFMESDLVSSVGGGICQVSSTLYSAALHAGLTIVERHSHSRRVSSVPPGRDATVWYGMADLKLRNDFEHPVKLKVSESNQSLQVALWGRDLRSTVTRVSTIPLPSSAPLTQVFQTARSWSQDGHSPRHEILFLDVYWGAENP